jgi:hypothetical protein
MPRGVYDRGKAKPRKAAPVKTDAMVYLIHAERAIVAGLKTGKAKRLTRPELMTLLALDALRGGE